jgi:hypothetical protein
MKSAAQFKPAVPLLLMTLATFCFAVPPRAQAVVPPPDGGYSNFTTAEGTNALKNLTTGAANTAVGWYSLFSASVASFNTGVGGGALALNNADSNTAVGAAALLLNTTGGGNTAVGAFALSSNTDGTANTAVGLGALQNNTGFENTATGGGALVSNVTGSANTAYGVFALENNTTGSSNTAVGTNAGQNATGDGNVYIGAGLLGTAGESNACYIASIFGQTSASGIQVFINNQNKLGTSTSSKRFKEEIQPMDKASETLFGLKPVTFRYRKGIDPQRIPQFGLVAEDVEAVNRDLVVRDKEGKPYSVRYDQVNAMLLNEFLKEHRKVEEQQATIAQLKREIETIVAHSKEQDSQIQRVRDQVQMNRPDAGVVVSNH